MRIERYAAVALLAAGALLAGCTSKQAAPSVAPPAPATSAAPAPASPESGGGDVATFTGNGVTFDYPADWQEVTLGEAAATSSTPVWQETVAVAEFDFVNVAEYTLQTPVTADTIGDQTDALTASLEPLFTQAGGQLDSGPESTTMGGLPALEYTATVQAPGGQTVKSRLVLAFDGSTEYFVNCQATDQYMEDVLAGCDIVVSSFQRV